MAHISQFRQFFLLFLIFALFALIFWNIKSFAPALLGAYTLYVLLRKPTHYLTETRQWNHKLSVAFTMFWSFVVILLPISGLIQLLSNKVVNGFQNSQQILESFKTTILNFETRIGMNLLTPERIQSLSEWGVFEVTNLINATLVGLVLLLMTYFILWFMLMDGEKMEHTFLNWLPLKENSIQDIRTELDNLVYSNALGIPMMGVVQGFFGFIGYRLAGIDDLWFWVFMTFVAGMIPFLGVSLAFIPLTIVLYSKGLTGEAAFILIYGIFVIGTVDNVARMWLMKKIGHTHPLITLFGVIIGVQLFGFIGFIFGPILIAMFLLLAKIYFKEFKYNETHLPTNRPSI